MYVGAASGAVTVGLALFLVLMSQKPDPSKAEQPETTTKALQMPDTQSPVPQAAVRLPPPPAPKVHAAGQRPPRSPLKPRAGASLPPVPRIAPLKPRPKPVPDPVGTAVAPLKPAAQTAAVPPEAPPPEAKSTPAQTVPRDAAIEGRALLRMLETGKGPVIEIAWPAAPGDRKRLYNLLTACHGMQTAMLVDRTRIYSATGAPGSAWRINRDAVSGFVRRPSGVLTEAERSVIRRIKARHGTGSGAPVRLFPRAVDAALLGGLGQIVGPGYLKYKTIRAHYRLMDDTVSVGGISVDGETRPGGIVLPRSRRCG